MDEDSAHHDGSALSSSVDTSPSTAESLSSLTQAIDKWVHDGQPIFNDLLAELHNAGTIVDPMVQTFVFSVVGGYTYNFSESMKNGLSVAESHLHSITSLMQNPSVEKLTQGFMQQAVDDHISKVVE